MVGIRSLECRFSSVEDGFFWNVCIPDEWVLTNHHVCPEDRMSPHVFAHVMVVVFIQCISEIAGALNTDPQNER